MNGVCACHGKCAHVLVQCVIASLYSVCMSSSTSLCASLLCVHATCVCVCVCRVPVRALARFGRP